MKWESRSCVMTQAVVSWLEVMNKRFLLPGWLVMGRVHRFPRGREIGDCSVRRRVLSCSHQVLHTAVGQMSMCSSPDEVMAALTEDRAFFRCESHREAIYMYLTNWRVGCRSTDVDELLYACGEFSDKVIVIIQSVLFHEKSLFIVDEVNEDVMISSELRIQHIELPCHSLGEFQCCGFVCVALQIFESDSSDE